jgi:hypothetical protein
VCGGPQSCSVSALLPQASQPPGDGLGIPGVHSVTTHSHLCSLRQPLPGLRIQSNLGQVSTRHEPPGLQNPDSSACPGIQFQPHLDLPGSSSELSVASEQLSWADQHPWPSRSVLHLQLQGQDPLRAHIDGGFTVWLDFRHHFIHSMTMLCHSYFTILFLFCV